MLNKRVPSGLLVLLVLAGPLVVGCSSPSPDWFYGSWACSGERFEGSKSIEVELTVKVDGNEEGTEGTFEFSRADRVVDDAGAWTRGADGIEIVPPNPDYSPILGVDHTGDVPDEVNETVKVAADGEPRWTVDVDAAGGKSVTFEIDEQGDDPLVYECELGS